MSLGSLGSGRASEGGRIRVIRQRHVGDGHDRPWGRFWSPKQAEEEVWARHRPVGSTTVLLSSKPKSPAPMPRNWDPVLQLLTRRSLEKENHFTQLSMCSESNKNPLSAHTKRLAGGVGVLRNATRHGPHRHVAGELLEHSLVLHGRLSRQRYTRGSKAMRHGDGELSCRIFFFQLLKVKVARAKRASNSIFQTGQHLP